MVTFEEKYSNRNHLVDDEEQTERKIRFWKWNSNSNQFVSRRFSKIRFDFRCWRFELNTTIEYPHGDKTLNDMLFHPVKLELVTTGNDGLMKIWSFVDENLLTSSIDEKERRTKIRFVFCFLRTSMSLEMFKWSKLSFLFMSIVVFLFKWEKFRMEFNIIIRTFSHRLDRTKIFGLFLWIFSLFCSFWSNKSRWIDLSFERNIICCSSTFSQFVEFDNTNIYENLSMDSSFHRQRSSFILHRLFWKEFSFVILLSIDSSFSFSFSFSSIHLVHFYSFDDGKCLTRKNSLFRQVESSLFIPNHQSSTFLPFKHSKLIFAIRKQVLFFPLFSSSFEFNWKFFDLLLRV